MILICLDNNQATRNKVKLNRFINQKVRAIDQDLLWLKAIIDQRLKDLPNRDTPQPAAELNPPALDVSEAGVFMKIQLQPLRKILGLVNFHIVPPKACLKGFHRFFMPIFCKSTT